MQIAARRLGDSSFFHCDLRLSRFRLSSLFLLPIYVFIFRTRNNSEGRLLFAYDLSTTHTHVKLSWMIDGCLPIKLPSTEGYEWHVLPVKLTFQPIVPVCINSGPKLDFAFLKKKKKIYISDEFSRCDLYAFICRQIIMSFCKNK